MKKIVLGNGFVANHLPYPIYPNKIEINKNSISKILDSLKADVIINCVGKTGRPNVDWCENNKSETAEANVAFPILLAEECEKRNIHMVHVGSGCIFFGESKNLCKNKDIGWKEDDIANPKSFYSKTKYSCDLAISDFKNVSILRIRMPISEYDTERNLINKLKNYDKIIDIPNSVTFMNDFVNCTNWIINNNKFGIYHVTNPEPLSAATIMTEYSKYVKNHKFKIISEKELDSITLAKRSNCILNSEKLNNNGFFMTPSYEALENCMNNFFKNLKGKNV